MIETHKNCPPTYTHNKAYEEFDYKPEITDQLHIEECWVRICCRRCLPVARKQPGSTLNQQWEKSKLVFPYSFDIASLPANVCLQIYFNFEGFEKVFSISNKKNLVRFLWRLKASHENFKLYRRKNFIFLIPPTHHRHFLLMLFLWLNDNFKTENRKGKSFENMRVLVSFACRGGWKEKIHFLFEIKFIQKMSF